MYHEKMMGHWRVILPRMDIYARRLSIQRRLFIKEQVKNAQFHQRNFKK